MINHERQALREYILSPGADFDVAVTLTMKQQDGPEKLDPIKASANLRHFLNRFNKKAYGNAFSRYGRQACAVSMLERSYSGRWHYHLAMENPFRTFFQCNLKIQDCWARTRWGYNEIQFTRIYNVPGWISYITKSGSTAGLDIENTHFDSLS